MKFTDSLTFIPFLKVNASKIRFCNVPLWKNWSRIAIIRWLMQGLLGKRHWTNIWITLNQYDVVPTSFVQVGPSPAYANVMPTILFHVLPWTNVSDMIKWLLAIFNIWKCVSFFFVLKQMYVIYSNNRSYFESFWR